MKLLKVTKTYKPVIKSVNVEEHTVEAIVSTAAVDRDNEIMSPSAFEKRLHIYKQHPVLLTSHKYFELQSIIGEAIDVKVTSEGLYAKFKYYYGEGNAEADWAFKLASKGIAAFSVGFIPHGRQELTPSKDNGGARRSYTDVELTEISQVVVGANREALVISSEKGQGIESELAGMAIKLFDNLVEKPEPDVTENYIRLRQRDPDDFKEDTFRTIWISRGDGIKAVVGKLKNPPQGQESSMVVQSYLFDKDKWTVEEAQAWVKDHKEVNPDDVTAKQIIESEEFEEAVNNIIENKMSEHKSYIDELLAKAGDKPEAEAKAEDVEIGQVIKCIKETVKLQI